MIDARTVVAQLTDVLSEAACGPTGGWSYFTDNQPEAGLLGTIRKLSAEDASRVVGTASVAAHVNHVIFGMKVSMAWITGNRGQNDWNESWTVTVVDDAQWSELIREAEDQYHALRTAIANFALTDEIASGVSAGGLAHIAYHLGAIQQKVELLKIS